MSLTYKVVLIKSESHFKEFTVYRYKVGGDIAEHVSPLILLQRVLPDATFEGANINYRISVFLDNIQMKCKLFIYKKEE